jgi:galactokinase
LIGEHTDYTGGFVLPLALEKRTVVVGVGDIVDVGSKESTSTILSVGMKGGPVVFDADPDILKPSDPFWSNYVSKT